MLKGDLSQPQPGCALWEREVKEGRAEEEVKSLEAMTGNVQDGRATNRLLYLMVALLAVEPFVRVFWSCGWWCMGF